MYASVCEGGGRGAHISLGLFARCLVLGFVAVVDVVAVGSGGGTPV